MNPETQQCGETPKRELVASSFPSPEAFAFARFVEGNAWDDIKQAMRAAFPKAKPDRVLAEVRKRFVEVASGDPIVMRGWCIASAQDLHRKMVECGDYPEALKAVKLVYDITQRPQKSATVNL